MSDPSSTPVILGAQEIVMGFGSQPVLDRVSMSIHEGERLGLIGRNGSGKSTLLHILAGLQAPDEGIVTRRQGTRVAMLAQECRMDLDWSVGDALRDATRRWRELAEEHARASEALYETGASDHEQMRAQNAFEHLDHTARLHNVWEIDTKVDRLSAALGLPGAERTLNTLSGGELRRVDLATALLTEPDVLLLDEPTNHIDAESASWIEHYLAGYRGSCILVTHDRYFLDNVVTRIVELDGRRLHSFPGNYERFLEYKAQVRDTDARTESNRQAALRRELAWFRRGPKARGTKQKARITRLDELAAEDGPQIDRDALFEIPTPLRLGKRVLEVEQIRQEIDGRVLFDRLTLILQAGMRVGLVGPNGCGKTTLLRVLMGDERPAKGSVTIGESTRFLYVDQSHEDIEPDRSVLDYVSGGANYWELDGRRIYVPGYLERLLFDMDSVRSPVRNLSGGERNRMVLAKKLLRGGNVLVLDEPTNDLDLATLRVLEDAVLAFEGCVLLVSHDRYFLNRLCTHLIVFEENGDTLVLSGNYDDYLAYCRTRDQDKRERSSVTTSPQAVSPDERRNGGPRPLTYMEKRELAGMEQTIESAEAEVSRLEATINERGFYEQPHEQVRPVVDALQQAREEADRLYGRWEELEARALLK